MESLQGFLLSAGFVETKNKFHSAAFSESKYPFRIKIFAFYFLRVF